jgi:hypothetical protein
MWDQGEQTVIRGWKKLRGGTICELEIPETSKRYVSSIVCRAEFAKVMLGEGVSDFGGLVYRVGEVVRGRDERGIYFYLERHQAEAHVF